MNHTESDRGIHNIIFLPGLGDDFLHAVCLTAFLLQRKFDEKKLPVFVFVRALLWFLRRYPSVEGRMREVHTLAKDKKANGETISLYAISGGVSVALLYALEHPENVDSIVCLAGWIQMPEQLRQEGNPAFVRAVLRLNQKLNAVSEDERAALADKVLLVQPEEDTRVPAAARVLPGAREVVIPYSGHLNATTLGLIRESLKEQGEIFRWLTKPLKQLL